MSIPKDCTRRHGTLQTLKDQCMSIPVVPNRVECVILGNNCKRQLQLVCEAFNASKSGQPAVSGGRLRSKDPSLA
jgi:hypothetical protein